MKFFKRFLSLILTFILIFSISVPCYASDTNTAEDESDPTGFNSWSLDEKIQYVGLNIVDFFSSFTGLCYGDTTEYRKWLLDYYARYPSAGVSNFYEYVANGLSFDDDTETWELSDDLVEFCNSLIVNYNDRVTMTYKYVVNPDNLDFSIFDNKGAAEELYNFIKTHPNYYFKCLGKYSERWGSSCVWVQVTSSLESAVSSNYNLQTPSCTLYDANWNTPIEHFVIGVNDIKSDTGQYWAYCPKSSPSNTQTGKTLSEIVDLIESDSIGSPHNLSTGVLVSSKYFKTTLVSNCIFSFNDNAINCYKSVDDMKKDSEVQFIGNYTNTYTGSTVNNITQTEINNIVNNYYPSEPDPDDPGGGGSSGSDSKDYTFLLERIISEIQNLNFSDLNDTLKEIKVLVSNLSQNLYDFSDMDSNISEMNKSIKDILEQLQDLNDNLVALARALVGKDTFDDALSGVKSKIPDDIILASVNELVELQEEALSFGGALGDIFSKLLDFQTGIDDLVQDEEYIDEVEDLLRQLLPKDPEDNEDDSFFDKVLKTIEMSLQLYANSVDEIKETSKKKFPFSIGYDIELLLMLLSADPQTPVFKIPFEYQRLNYKTEIVIDFSMFDDAIDVIRFFLTIYYCFFLLMITPKMIGLNNEVDS